ncbi:hypothetical protein ONZ43_g4451 [Nemania bipapillata]|uniref:Uncharacterized protein n=1 Tax=Nemania bipapillata TaxID=110536 RepID=A0ACC2IMN7_9PEZI|nr:hypothetical protein ONZ43_g4451 [Nemania bipapillata]
MADRNDCTTHHLDFPDPEGAEFPQPRAYDAEELLQPLTDILDSASLNARQKGSIYEFVTDYVIADTGKMTAQEARDIIEVLLVRIDDYFFKGGLTQGPIRLIRLRVLDESRYLLNGFYLPPTQYYTGRIVIYLRDYISGRRRATSDILTTLVHELAHAYCGIFFNFCPVNNNRDIVMANGGHGILWQQVYQAMYTHMRTWDPRLARVGIRTPPAVPFPFVRSYYDFMSLNPRFRNAWDVTDLEPWEPRLLPNPRWHWRPARKEMFKRALLRMTFEGYPHFLSTRVITPLVAYRLYRAYKYLEVLTRGVIVASTFLSVVAAIWGFWQTTSGLRQDTLIVWDLGKRVASSELSVSEALVQAAILTDSFSRSSLPKSAQLVISISFLLSVSFIALKALTQALIPFSA